ncbi:MAG: DegT/DnrJ/EryC1/StrS family aminotransferase, partial [Lachnospiraceae bacterium]|nr:DegT/DnrJ/EryC1/StrS family aminotransferase [Lachnospiraceae bacterium]
ENDQSPEASASAFFPEETRTSQSGASSIVDPIGSVVSTNARMPEWQAAVLRARMLRLDADIEKREENARYLSREMVKFPFLEMLDEDPRITRNSLHLFVFKYKKEGLSGVSRRDFIRALAAENVAVPGEGYSDPLYKAQFLYSDDFTRLTGRTFTDPTKELPGNERMALEEGCWLYHTSLLGERADMDLLLEAIEKISRGRDDLKRVAERS